MDQTEDQNVEGQPETPEGAEQETPTETPEAAQEETEV